MHVPVNMCVTPLQAEVEALQARNHQLLEENAMQHDQLQGKLSEHELKLKTEMVYNVSAGRAGCLAGWASSVQHSTDGIGQYC